MDKKITTQDYIVTQIKKFDLPESKIAELKQAYMPLQLKNIDDKDGYKAIKTARILIKNYRIDVEKRRKDIVSDVVKFQKAINTEAKRITALLEPIENHLEAQEDIYDKEQQRIAFEKEEAEKAKFHKRINQLFNLGYSFNGSFYHCQHSPIQFNTAELKILSEHHFNNQIFNLEVSFNKFRAEQEANQKALQEKLEREEAERKTEAERLKQERIRLETIAKEQAEKEAALKAEAERIESLKRYEESKRAVIESKIECEKNGCQAPIHQRPTIVIEQDQAKTEDAPYVMRDILIDEETIQSAIRDSAIKFNSDEIKRIIEIINENIDVAIMDCVDKAIDQVLDEQQT